MVGQGEFSEFRVFPAYYLQTIKPTTSTPLLRYGDDVVGSVNKYGKGRAYLIGTLLGHAGLAYDDPKNGDFLASILARAGLGTERVGKLKRRRRVFGNQQAWFLFNATSDPVEETFRLDGFKSVHDLLEEPFVGTQESFRVKVDPLDVRCLIFEA